MQIASTAAIQTFKVWFLLATLTLIEERVSKIGMTLSGSFFTVVGILCRISFQAINLCVHACVFVFVCMCVCVCAHMQFPTALKAHSCESTKSSVSPMCHDKHCLFGEQTFLLVPASPLYV